MCVSWTVVWVLGFTSILVLCPYSITAQPFDYPTANLSTSWINSVSAPHSIPFTDGSTVRAILLRGSFGPKFACGFFCNGNCISYLFAIFIVQTNSGSGITMPASGFPQVVWSANRDNPVSLNATLNLTSLGDLILRDADGSAVWSTNTTGKSVTGLNLTDSGNLVLFDVNNSVVWQSFEHPTDCLVPGQKLVSGQKLTASVSSTNWTQQGLFSLLVTNEGLFAQIESNPPQVYYQNLFTVMNISSTEPNYVILLNGSLALNNVDLVISIPEASSAQYMKLGSDGHLRVIEWGIGWKNVADLLTGYLGECHYPMACGKNAICSSQQQCSCPRSITAGSGSNYFRQVNDRQPDLGCSEITPIMCNASQYQSFVELEDVYYFTFNFDMKNVDAERCKQACLNNCSCKAALFQHGLNSSNGDCYLPSEVFTLMNNNTDNMHYNASAFMKVQGVPNALPPPSTPSQTPARKRKNRVAMVLAVTIGSSVLLLLMVGYIITFILRKRRNDAEIEEEYLDQVPGMPTRFSYEELKVATQNFSKKLGEGGFGSVFEGTLEDGQRIAVKCLDGFTQVKKSFLAEVKSIGSIHHVNLVRLIGFCAWKSQRLLVYEYMSNGSLDKWIYHGDREHVLEWKCRKKIILDIAKGLAYLHEDCRQKILHLDIKPQNILLDENFNAKVSDFGLSKLIDRNQSQVMTTMRGTPGYLAPEWLSSVITEKVDVYSFGIVVLETLCGRKNFDRSEPDERMHLLSLFRRSAEEGMLLDMVDKYSEDMQSNGAQVLEMMKLASWCLQSDFNKRPSMSVVVKVLEGVIDVESEIDYCFSDLPMKNDVAKLGRDCTPLLPSLLSGPR